MTSNVQSPHLLIAAWPGMGNVAVLAAHYLVQRFGFQPSGELQAPGHFDIGAVEVSAGLIKSPRQPRNVFYTGTLGENGLRTTVFVGESQPAQGAYALAGKLMDFARAHGVTRVVTFASLGSQMHPTDSSSVHGAATAPEGVEQLKDAGVTLMEGGQIGGLNGVVLGAAMERGVNGQCLLGEIPFFAAGVPNPKAVKSVLDTFATVMNIDLDTSDLDQHIEGMERVLLQMMERLQNQHGAGPEFPSSDDAGQTQEPGQTHQGQPRRKGIANAKIDDATRQRIEELFETARGDRSKSAELKAELDRLGVFASYEDRFLDLFKRAE